MPLSARQRRLKEQVNVARKMFWGGCALLPFLWMVNLIYFRKELMSSSTPAPLKSCAWLLCANLVRRRHCIPDARVAVTYAPTDLRKSLAGLCIVTAMFVTWVVVFQTSWEGWGETGTDLLVVQPVSTCCDVWRLCCSIGHGTNVTLGLVCLVVQRIGGDHDLAATAVDRRRLGRLVERRVLARGRETARGLSGCAAGGGYKRAFTNLTNEGRFGTRSIIHTTCMCLHTKHSLQGTRA